jgi:hypothetical protein
VLFKKHPKLFFSESRNSQISFKYINDAFLREKIILPDADEQEIRGIFNYLDKHP